jgi:Uma2 family endonuclease
MTLTTERLERMLEPPKRRITPSEFLRMREFGLFREERLELIGGEIVEMAPIGDDHIASTTAASHFLFPDFGKGYCILVQQPIDLGDSAPQPDIAVVRGELKNLKSGEAKDLVLVIEVSKTTLDYDRVHKGSLYARAGIPDYWVINLVDKCVEGYREPVEMLDQPFGWGYKNRAVYPSDATVSPLEKPDVKIKVSDLLL